MLFFWICAAFAVLGLAGYALQYLAIRAHLSPPDSGEGQALPRPFPPISILKPLKGLDDGLFDNLESFCNLEYPRYEIIFALQDRNDPAHKVAQKIREKYPQRDITILVQRCADGLNPKVNNLIPALGASKYDCILISDSNVRVEPGYLASIAAHLEDPAVGLVSNVIRGTGSRSLGATLENLHLNSFILGSVCFLDRFLRMPCVIGKSMLMRKRDLEVIGGLAGVKDLLAEDYIIGERMHRLGKKVVLSSHAINNVNEYWGIRKFMGRHVRWGRLRWRIGGIKYLSELLSNAVFMSALPTVFLPLTTLTVLFPTAVWVAKILFDMLIGRRIEADMHPLRYLLSPVKDLMIGLAWFVPIMSNTVSWRGNRYIIGKNSMLSPCIAGIRPRVSGAVAAIRTRLAWAKA